MSKRTAVISIVLAMILAVVAVTPGMAKPDKTTANSVAVCGCGKVFVPDATTEYLTYSGKQYACCTHACHEMAAKDVAGSAKMFDAVLAKMMAPKPTLAVVNVASSTDKGIKAVCGCGKEFTINQQTEYLTYNGKVLACCTPECHAMAAKDPAAAAKQFEETAKKLGMTF